LTNNWRFRLHTITAICAEKDFHTFKENRQFFRPKWGEIAEIDDDNIGPLLSSMVSYLFSSGGRPRFSNEADLQPGLEPREAASDRCQLKPPGTTVTKHSSKYTYFVLDSSQCGRAEDEKKCYPSTAYVNKVIWFEYIHVNTAIIRLPKKKSAQIVHGLGFFIFIAIFKTLRMSLKMRNLKMYL
jgi:hypothetical protein